MFKGSQKFCIEMNTLTDRFNLVDGVENYRVPLQNTLGFYQALGVDWLTKAMPNPKLFMDMTILKQVALRRITNPVELGSFILGEDLSKKVTPKLFFRSVLTDQFFDSWDKIKIAVLLLMITDNVQKTLNRIVDITQRFNRDYNFYRLINLSLKMRVTLNCFMTAERINKQISILDKEDKYLFKGSCYINVDGSFNSCIDLVGHFSSYALSAVSIADFEKEQVKSIYFGTLPLPKGMKLIETSKELIKEGRRMSHCAASYVPRLMSKKSFFLHIKLEVSATVEIVKNRKKRCFEIEQIRGVSNNSVPASVTNSVKKAISTIEAQYFFFKNSYKSRKSKRKIQVGPTLFDDLVGW